jgi:hypothetical protein
MTCGFARDFRRVLLFSAAIICASPAFADHLGPSGFGSGGGMSVFTPDTLDAGHWSAGFRVTYTRPEQRSDEELEALAAEHIHAHNTDYNLNASVGVAYGINHHLTVSAELPYVRRDDLREGTHSHSGGRTANGVEQLGSVSGLRTFIEAPVPTPAGPAWSASAGVAMQVVESRTQSLIGTRVP